MSIFPLKPTSSYVKAYFAALAKFQQHGQVITVSLETNSIIAALPTLNLPKGEILAERVQA